MANETPQSARPAARDTGASQGMGMPAILAIVLPSLVVGALFGYFLLGGLLKGLFGSELVGGRVSLSESDLDQTVATYTVDGKTYEISFKDAILENGSLEAARRADGSYRVPSADSVLATARSQVMTAEAERLGIVVGDDEVAAYAMATFGTTDLPTIASAYGMEQDAAAVLLREAAIMSALRNKTLANEVGEAPAAPETPGEAEEVTMTEGYAAYIINLVGDEWDAATGTWATTDGPFASALADYEITSTGATYEAARQAYYVAYQRHVAALSEYASQWTDYVNRLLGNASITITTLAM